MTAALFLILLHFSWRRRIQGFKKPRIQESGIRETVSAGVVLDFRFSPHVFTQMIDAGPGK